MEEKGKKSNIDSQWWRKSARDKGACTFLYGGGGRGWMWGVKVAGFNRS